MVEKFMPDIYQKSIYYINYDKLYKKGVRCLLFDLDNTIKPSHVIKPTKRLKKLFDELKDKGFKVIISSLSLCVDACAFSLKPRKDKYLKIMEKFKYKHTEIAAIGDQLLTDVYGANRLDIVSVLVNPMSEHDYSITWINRIFEKFIYGSLEKKDVFKKGEYYD